MRIRLSLLPCLLGALLVTALPATAENYVMRVNRFQCGSGAEARFVNIPGGNGLGPTRAFVYAACHTQAAATSRNAGLNAVFIHPRDEGGPYEFDSLTVAYKLGGTGLAGESDSYVKFYTTNTDGRNNIITKRFSQMHPTVQSGDFRTISVGQSDFSPAKISQLKMVNIYVEKTSGQADINIGDIIHKRRRSSLIRQFSVGSLNFDNDGCQR